MKRKMRDFFPVFRVSGFKFHKSGFTLVETLVAITIVVFGVSAPLAVSSRNITASIYARDQIIATFLAQEGIEIVRNIRDRDMLENEPDFFDEQSELAPCVGTTCVIDSVGSESVGNEIDQCSPVENCKPLYFDSATGVYDQPFESLPLSGNPSIFKRTVTITDPAGGTAIANEAVARVTVTWRTQSGQKSVTLEEVLFKFISQ